MLISVRLLLLYFVCVGSVVALARWLRRPMEIGTTALLAGLPLLFLWQGVFLDRTPVPTDHVLEYVTPWKALAHPHPHNATLSDVATQFAPWAKAVRVAWKDHSLPFRNRWSGCGTPLAANGQSAAFSPLTFLMFTLPLGRAFVLAAAVKLLLAATGSWLWLSELGASRSSARFGAITFAFSFAMTPWLYHPATADICLWPWMLFAIERGAETGDRRGFWLLILAAMSALLGGHLETFALGLLFAALFLILRVILRDPSVKRIAFARTALAFVLAAALCGFFLIPHLLAIAASNRLALAKDPSHFQYVPWVPYKPPWLGGFVTTTSHALSAIPSTRR